MLTIVFIAIQLVSLAIMLLFVHEYKRIAHKHEVLLHTIEPGVKPSSKLQSTIIIWIYVIVIFVIMFATTAMFVYSPISQ